MPDFHSLSIHQIEKDTSNAVVISFEIPASLQSHYQFTPGQYVTLLAILEGETLRRSYSICSSPNEKYLSIGVKKIDGGVFSSYANTSLKVGDVLSVSEPEGRFTYVPKEQPETVAAFAAGSGITPIMAILKSVLDAQPENRFYLMYGNKTPADTLFYETLKALQTAYAERLSIFWVFSQAHEENSLFGRIDSAFVNYHYKQSGLADSYYLCGPEAMIKNVSESLREKDVPSNRILHELFYSDTQAGSAPPKLSGDSTEITVVCDGMSKTFQMHSEEIILDAVLNQKIDAPYSCQGGVCSSCIAKVTKGAAVMDKNEILTDNEIEEGLVLTCQARPTEVLVAVDYDDV